MEQQYLDYMDCYKDTLMCLNRSMITEIDLKLLVEHYENQEEYECCSAILHALEEYKNENRNIKENSKRQH